MGVGPQPQLTRRQHWRRTGAAGYDPGAGSRAPPTRLTGPPLTDALAATKFTASTRAVRVGPRAAARRHARGGPPGPADAARRAAGRGQERAARRVGRRARRRRAARLAVARRRSTATGAASGAACSRRSRAAAPRSRSRRSPSRPPDQRRPASCPSSSTRWRSSTSRSCSCSTTCTRSATARAIADLDRLLRHPPPALRIVAATRVDPPLRLGRMRIAGELTDIRERDLAFTEAETGGAAAHRGHRAGRRRTSALLWQRTEGWAAGLRMAALTLRTHPEPARFVAAFAGDDAAMADYLARRGARAAAATTSSTSSCARRSSTSSAATSPTR